MKILFDVPRGARFLSETRRGLQREGQDLLLVEGEGPDAFSEFQGYEDVATDVAGLNLRAAWHVDEKGITRPSIGIHADEGGDLLDCSLPLRDPFGIMSDLSFVSEELGRNERDEVYLKADSRVGIYSWNYFLRGVFFSYSGQMWADVLRPLDKGFVRSFAWLGEIRAFMTHRVGFWPDISGATRAFVVSNTKPGSGFNMKQIHRARERIGMMSPDATIEFGSAGSGYW